MRRILLLSLSFFISQGVLADDSLWTDLETYQTEEVAARGVLTSDRYNYSRQLTLDENTLLETLQNAPTESTGDLAARSASPVTISLPLPDGSFAEVEVYESSIMESGLAETLPDVKTWRVFGTDGKVLSGRIGHTPKGLHATLTMASGDVVYIDAEDADQDRLYHSLSHTDNAEHAGVFNCEVPGHDHSNPQSFLGETSNIFSRTAARVAQTPGNQVREYRLAVATTPAFAGVAGGTTDSVAASIATVVNRLNEIYQRDVGIRFKLVANNNDLIFGATDVARTPLQAYTTGNNGAMLLQNQANIDNVITSAGYDVGQVFDHVAINGSSGLATSPSACSNNFKAQGASGFMRFLDGFAANMVAHELAHQFSASHSYNGVNLNCSQRSAGTAFEPGSGSTIMSYAGVCGTDNLQSSADSFFHGGSIQQIVEYTTNGAGNTCGTLENVSNVAPEAEAGDDVTIPLDTPFELTGMGTDADGDALSYSWEQFNVSPTAATLAQGDIGTNGIIRSRPPTTEQKRQIPSWLGQYSGDLDKGEILPSQARSGANALKMILTVRDQKFGADIDDMTITVGTNGPFEVTSHTAVKQMLPGDVETVTWNPAGTETSCENVAINLLSGDATYGDAITSIPLEASEVNDGSAEVTIPAVADIPQPSRVRFQVKCNNNIFYALSKTNLGVTVAPDDENSETTFTVSDVQRVEGTSGISHMKVTVTIVPSQGNKLMGYRLVHGSTDINDFAFAPFSNANPDPFDPTSVVIPNIAQGERSYDIQIPINSDDTAELNDTFNVQLYRLVVNAAGQLGFDDGGALHSEATMIILDDDTPTVEATVSGGTVIEGNSNVEFTVTLSATSIRTLTVKYETSDGTAEAGSDYRATSGTLTIPAGQLTGTILVPVTDDTVFEADESFNLTLTEPAAGLAFENEVASLIAAGNITENETIPTLSIDSPTLAEGNTGNSPMTFTVTLSGLSQSNVTVDYATGGGDATPNTDYTAVPTTLLTIPAGQLSETFTVDLIGDTVEEANQTFNVTLSNAIGATIADGVGVGTIQDDEITRASIAPASSAEGNSGGSNTLDFIVTLSAPATAGMSLSYATSNGTALAGSDYTAVTAGTLNFTVGSPTGTISIPINGDTTPEDNETLTVTLSNALPIADLAIAANGASAEGTITNDDVHATVSASIAAPAAPVVEGNSTIDTTFTVTLTPAPTQTVTIDYTTQTGSADASDFVAKTDTLTFAPGVATQTIVVTVNGDTTFEPDETFNVVLSNPAGSATAPGATITQASAAAVIANDDNNRVSVSAGSVSEGAGTVDLIFTLDGPHLGSAPLTFDFTTVDGTADAADYTQVNTPQTVTFASGGPVSQTIPVGITDDSLNELDETFSINMTNASSGLTLVGAATVTINDNDLSVVSIATGAAATVAEGNSSTATASFVVSLSSPANNDVVVNYQTADGSATVADNDYVAQTSGSITIPAGDMTGTITVAVNGDLTFEATETFGVTLTSVSPATDAALHASNTSATGTITADDNNRVSVADVSVSEGAGTVDLVFTLIAPHVGSSPLTFDFTTVDGTAGAADYTQVTTPQTVTFASGSSVSQTIPLNITEDNVNEVDETFTVNMTNASPGLTLVGGATVIINDNDLAVVSIAAGATATVAEGNSSTTAVEFGVSLSSPAVNDVVVNYQTSDGSATAADSDYVAETSGSITIPAGSTTGTITVDVNGDTTVEAMETFNVTLTSVSPAADAILHGSDTSAVGTINNDDASVVSVSSPDPTTEGETGETTNMVFNVTLDKASFVPVTVDYTVNGITATAGADFTALPAGTLSFNGTETEKTVTVVVTGDIETEVAETLNLVLSSPSTGLSLGTATGVGTINNDDTDTDGDTLSDAQEAITGTDPQVADTDGDSDNDAVEVFTNSGTISAPSDSDGDGIIDALEGVADETDAEKASVPLSTTMAASLGLAPGVYGIATSNGDTIKSCGNTFPVTTETSSDVSAVDPDYDFPNGLFHVCVTSTGSTTTLTLTYPPAATVVAGSTVRILTSSGTWESLAGGVVTGRQAVFTITDTGNTAARTAKRFDLDGDGNELEIIAGIAKRSIMTGNVKSGGGSMSLFALMLLSMFTLLCVARRRRSVAEL